MNYSKIYFNLIEHRKQNPPTGYVERHHILPRSLGGSDSSDNLVDLSAREHFIAHLLLTKMYSEGTSEYFKMIRAFMMMLTCKSENQERFLSSKKYETIRTEFAKAQSLSQTGSGNSQFGKNKSTELRNRIREGILKTLAEKGLGEKKKMKEHRQLFLTEKRKKRIDLYKKYYIIYEEVGFEEFVKRTGYDKTQANLVQRFKQFLPDFKPQNGKKRGK